MYMRERDNSSDEIATLDKNTRNTLLKPTAKKKMEIVLSQTLTRNPNETKHVTEYRIKSNQTKRHTETEIERVAFFELIEENSKSEREDEEHKDVVLRQKKIGKLQMEAESERNKTLETGGNHSKIKL